ncbi:hypothetical protein D3C75_714010 [compost metagenome]
MNAVHCKGLIGHKRRSSRNACGLILFDTYHNHSGRIIGILQRLRICRNREPGLPAIGAVFVVSRVSVPGDIRPAEGVESIINHSCCWCCRAAVACAYRTGCRIVALVDGFDLEIIGLAAVRAFDKVFIVHASLLHRNKRTPVHPELSILLVNPEAPNRIPGAAVFRFGPGKNRLSVPGSACCQGFNRLRSTVIPDNRVGVKRVRFTGSVGFNSEAVLREFDS